MRTRVTASLALVAAAGLVLAGCESVPDGAREAQAFECPLGEEGCDENIPVGEGGDLAVTASVETEFSFQVDDPLTVTGPEIAVEFENAGTALHNVEAIGGAEGSEVVEAAPGDGATGNFALFPGEWTIICNVPGHQAAGMEATVIVYATAEELEAAEAEGVDPNGAEADLAEGA